MKDILTRIDALAIRSRIIVHSDGVAIPWEVIYPARVNEILPGADDQEAIDITKFWVYRFEFETILTYASSTTGKKIIYKC